MTDQKDQKNVGDCIDLTSPGKCKLKALADAYRSLVRDHNYTLQDIQGFLFSIDQVSPCEEGDEEDDEG
jgi:hypothetical protein